MDHGQHVLAIVPHVGIVAPFTPYTVSKANDLVSCPNYPALQAQDVHHAVLPQVRALFDTRRPRITCTSDLYTCYYPSTFFWWGGGGWGCGTGGGV